LFYSPALNSLQVFLAEEVETKKFYAMKALKKTEVSNYSDPAAICAERNVLSVGSNFPYLPIFHSTFSTKVGATPQAPILH